MDHFHTQAKNFFDHNNIGNSNAFLPLTIDGALIQGNELTIRSPRILGCRPSRTSPIQTRPRMAFGAISGGLTDFSPPAGGFALDHDQRNTANAGLDAEFAVAGVCIDETSTTARDLPTAQAPPSHLPGHAESI